MEMELTGRFENSYCMVGSHGSCLSRGSGHRMSRECLFFVACLLIVVLPMSSAMAQRAPAERSHFRGSSLNQLGFDLSDVKQDIPDKTTERGVKLLEDLLETDLENKKPDRGVPRARMKSGSDSVLESVGDEDYSSTSDSEEITSTSHKVVIPRSTTGFRGEYGFLVPRLKGPWTDEKDSTRITSRRSWRPKKSSPCHDPKTDLALYHKAESVKEILFRYSGSDDFYDSLSSMACKDACRDSERIARITGFAVADTRGGSFKIHQLGRQCRYQLSKPKSGEWMMLEGVKVICTCLPDKYK